MLHILAGDSQGDPELILNAAEKNKHVNWIVPKNAKENEHALFHLPVQGFTARGVIATEPNSTGTGRYRARVRNVTLLPISVPLAFVRQNQPTWKWPTYPRSYTTISGAIQEALEQLLADYQNALVEPLIEGTPRTASTTLYERNPIARRQCIVHYGSTCFVCDFSFGDTYGEIADGYIHVHHLTTVSSRGGRHVVDPIKDLRPVCPNCHAVAHLRNPPLGIRELKGLINRKSS